MIDIEKAREKATLNRLRNEYIDVKLLNKNLGWRIDYREIDKWKRALTAKGEPFEMIDRRTGEVLWSDKTNLKRNLE